VAVVGDPSFAFGSIRGWVVADGVVPYETEWLFPRISRDEWLPLVEDHLDADGKVTLPYQPVLLECGGRLILSDAGLGHELAGEWEMPAGRTLDGLDALGVAPADIEIVVVTHAHADHTGGLTAADGPERVPVYANARHILSRLEWDYWRSAEAGDDDRETFRSRVESLHDAGILDLVEGEADVAPGVGVFPTPGHTPGHLSIGLESGGRHGLIAGDAITGDWSVRHPEWVTEFDIDPEQCVATRRALLSKAAEDGSLVAAYHLRGAGLVRSDGDAFAFTPSAS
jgi:glyoxylase-like metal-dependent hydrolase (beta-lactamase superfamily II)